MCRSLLAIVLALFFPCAQAVAASLSLDESFAFDRSLSAPVQSILTLPDGKALVTGGFAATNGLPSGVARLNSDGTVDATFNAGGIGANGPVHGALVTLSGIYIYGAFTQYNGQPVPYYALLNSDGTLAGGFNPGSGPDAPVYGMLPAGRERYFIVGAFTHYNGAARGRIARVQSNGALDTSVFSAAGFNNTVRQVALQADGKLLLIGDFTTYNTTAANRLTRLDANSDAIDLSFQVTSGFDTAPRRLVRTPDGRIYVGGNFTSYNGTARRTLIRLNSTGTVDTGFTPSFPTGSEVNALAVQSDGMVIVGGSFASVNGQGRANLVRLNTAAGIDLSFNPESSISGNVLTVAVQTNGMVLAGGDFQRVDGGARNLARLKASSPIPPYITVQPKTQVVNAGEQLTLTVSASGSGQLAYVWRRDGVPLSGFNSGTAALGRAASQHSGNYEVVISSLYGSVTSSIANVLVVGPLNAGAIDPSFRTDLSGAVTATAIQADGKILLGGTFTTVNGVARTNVARVDSDGNLDPTFNAGTASSTEIARLLPWGDHIVVAGSFTNWNNQARGHLVWLTQDGSLDLNFAAPFSTASGVSTIVLQGNKLLVGGNFTYGVGPNAKRNIARLNSNGMLDATFNPTPGPDAAVTAILPLPDGKILIGGAFTNVNNVPKRGVALINTNGALEGSFTVGLGPNQIVTSLGADSIGGYLVGGWFDRFAGESRRGLVRLVSTGNVDTNFHSGGGLGSVNSIYVQPDGRILVGGVLDAGVDEIRRAVFRLATNGTIETTFNATYQGFQRTLTAQPDNKLIVGGFGNTEAHVVRLLLQSSPSTSSPPSVVVQPKNLTIESGSSGSFAAMPAGTQPLAMQWYFNGFRIPDATNAAFTIRTAGTATVGNYQLLVTNSFGSMTSRVVRLELDTPKPPSVLQQPSSSTNLVGETASLNAVINGTPPLFLQWFKDNLPLANETNATITITNLQESHSGAYHLAATNHVGVVQTAPANLLVVAPQIPDGAVEPGFQPNGGAINGYVSSLVVQPDNRIVLAGTFQNFGGIARGRIARITAAGELETGFTPVVGFDGAINSLSLQQDGKILVGGSFLNFAGQSRYKIARLNADGALDTSFNPQPGVGGNGSVYTALALPNGKVIIAGSFPHVNNTVRQNIARLHENGAIDTNFNARAIDNSIRALNRQTDGKLLIGGAFTRVDGLPRRAFARLHPDGQLDSSFVPQLSLPTGFGLETISLQADGRILVGGFQTFVRVLPSGAIDPDFTQTQTDGLILFSATLPDGKILIAGQFSNINGAARDMVARLHSNGDLDQTFDPGQSSLGQGIGYAGALLADGSLMLGGRFDRYNGLPVNNVIRLRSRVSQSVLTVSDPGWNSGEFGVRAPAMHGTNYVLQTKASDSADWTPIRTNAGNSTLQVFADPAATNDVKLYRIRAEKR